MTILDLLVMVVIVFQLILIYSVTRNVSIVTEATMGTLTQSGGANAPVSPLNPSDSLQVELHPDADNSKVVTSSMEEDSVVRSNGITDSSPTIISIILTLITLCVTLSIVIPYVEGKTMTESKIREVAKEYYADAFESIERFYRVTLDDSMWEDAHTARMTAYFLQKGSEEEKVWSIGWASKSILRYLMLIRKNPDRYGRNIYQENDFISNCIGYIKAADVFSNMKEAGVGTSAESVSKKPDPKKLIRAFSDLSYATFLAEGLAVYDDLNDIKEKMYGYMRSTISRKDINLALRKHERIPGIEDVGTFLEEMKVWLDLKEQEDKKQG